MLTIDIMNEIENYNRLAAAPSTTTNGGLYPLNQYLGTYSNVIHWRPFGVGGGRGKEDSIQMVIILNSCWSSWRGSGRLFFWYIREWNLPTLIPLHKLTFANSQTMSPGEYTTDLCMSIINKQSRLLKGSNIFILVKM